MARTPTERPRPSSLPVSEHAPERPEPRRGEAHGLSLIAALEARLALASPASPGHDVEIHLSAAGNDARIGTTGPSQEVVQ